MLRAIKETRMRQAIWIVLCLLAFAVSTARAQSMDATMKRGDTQTFTVPFDYTAQTFAVGAPLNVVITASPELVLGHTTLQSFNCTETPNVNTCRGTIPASGSQTITITQVLTVNANASKSPGSWTIQVVSVGLSSLVPKTGKITIPDAGPNVIMTKRPEGLERTFPSLNPATGDSMTFKNIGNKGTTVSVEIPKEGFFFPDFQFDLLPGQEKTIPIRESLLDFEKHLVPGLYVGATHAEGEGVDPSMNPIILRLLVKEPPELTPNPEPSANRVELSASAGDPNPKGSVTFTNRGAGVVAGLAFSDAPWLIPSGDEFSLRPAESKSLTFTIDIAKQQQALAANGGTGSLTGTLTLRYLLPTSGKTASTAVLPLGNPPGTGSVSVTLVSTVTPSVSSTTIPPLPDIHGQLFLAGVGHAQGSVGLFISDLTIFPQVMRGNSSFRSLSLTDVDLYYTPLGGGTSSSKATLVSVAPPNVAAMGDFVGTVYGATQQIGSLQIRTPGYLAGEGAVGVNANVFNVSGKAGTFGTSIPVFTFDKFSCGQDVTKKLYLTGLRKDASGHTNFYIQETCGSPAKVTLDFYDPTGIKVGSTTTDVPPFAAIQLGTSVVPNGAVSAVLSHAAGSSGGFVGYATPVDELSGDTWAQVDWPNQRHYKGSDPVIIPVAGATPGANNTYFRTDLSIMNTGTTAGVGTLRFYNRTGETIDKTINLNPLQTATYVDVTTTLFGITTPHVGYMVFTPSSGTFVLTSRNYSTPVGSNASFGTAVPTLSLSAALRSPQLISGTQFPGDIRRIGGIEDASPDTIAAQRGATFRSNFGLIETTGQPVTVKVTVYYTYTSSLTSTLTGASTTFDLAPRQFMLVGLGSAIFGANRASAGDLHNITVEFEVTGGTGKVLPFISSVDNGSSDSTFRSE